MLAVHWHITLIISMLVKGLQDNTILHTPYIATMFDMEYFLSHLL